MVIWGTGRASSSGLRTPIRVFVVAPVAERGERVIAEGETKAEGAQRLVDDEDRE